MPLVFRTTGAWGTGKLSGLTSTEIDNNFYELNRDKITGIGNTGTITTTGFIQTSYPVVAPTTLLNPGTGALNDLPVSLPVSVSTGASSFPSRGAADPTGRFLYVTTPGTSSIRQFIINQLDGALTVVGTETVSDNNATVPMAIAVDPSGRYAYVGSYNTSVIRQYSINETLGSLAPLGSPSVATSGNFPRDIVIDPKGRYLYVSLYGSNLIQYFLINTDGTLTTVGTVASNTPSGITIDPTGRFLYACNLDTNTVSHYAINQTSGVLTLVASELTLGIFSVGTSPETVTVDPTGRFLYVTGSDLRTFSINQSTGVLTAINTTSIGGTNRDLEIDPSGRFAYVANSGSPSTIRTFRINQSTGVLTLLSSNTIAISDPSRIIIDPSGKFVYVPNNTAHNIFQYVRNNFSVGSATISGNLNISGSVSSATGTLSIANNITSSSSTTGALTVAGGVGVAGNLIVAGAVNLGAVSGDSATIGGAAGRLIINTSGNTPSIRAQTSAGATAPLSLYSGSIAATNGLTVTTAGHVTINSTTASTTSATGALVVAGGVGIAGNLNVGGTTTIRGNMYIDIGSSNSIKLGHDSNDSFLIGSISKDTAVNLSLVYGGYYNGLQNYISNQNDAYATRFVTGLGMALSDSAYKFQRASSKSAAAITWIDLLSISAEGGNVTARGNVSAVDFNSTSDIRFKKDLEKISNALNKVKQLTGYTYTLIETNTRSTGLIAQEVEEILPESVGGDDNKKVLSYGSMMGLIVEAIKELSSKVEDLQNQSMNK